MNGRRNGIRRINSFPALKRAARKARLLAERLNTPFYVLVDGRVVDLNAKRNRPKSKKGKPK